MTDEEIQAHYDEVNKLHSELTSALASRDYYKELAEAADKVIMHFKIGQPDTTYYSLESNLLIKQYQQLKQSK